MTKGVNPERWVDKTYRIFEARINPVDLRKFQKTEEIRIFDETGQNKITFIKKEAKQMTYYFPSKTEEAKQMNKTAIKTISLIIGLFYLPISFYQMWLILDKIQATDLMYFLFWFSIPIATVVAILQEIVRGMTND